MAAAERWLGVPAPLVINEYGMTEMCSQLYDLTPFNSHPGEPACLQSEGVTGIRAKLGPPWLRAAAVDPMTLRPVPEGRVGMLSFFDLANVGSVSALVTEDFGIVDRNEMFVLGRAPGEPRDYAAGPSGRDDPAAARAGVRQWLGIHQLEFAGLVPG